jgi:hypothetical protein
MEVHAHTHTSRKKWTHYFWEFLMLFLAVFCGFLAEYQLEHVIERNREKQYMESMLEDLASDTTSLNRTLIRANAMAKGFDSLKKYLYNIENIEKNTPIIYSQNATYTRNIIPSLSDQTATQLRNSGNMRLIRKRSVANAISLYWRNSINLENTANNFNDLIAEKLKAEDVIFNRQFYRILSESNPSTGLDIYFNDPKARLMTGDKKVLISYANYTDRLQKFIEQYITPQLKRLTRRMPRSSGAFASGSSAGNQLSLG